jgi:hypothetical protein
MREQEQPPSEAVEVDTTSDEIARAMGSVWARFAGQRPKSTNVVIEGDRVRCVIQEGAVEPPAEGDETAPAEALLTPATFGYNAMAAVRRATGRKVVGFIPNRDKTTEVSTQVFILERQRRKF